MFTGIRIPREVTTCGLIFPVSPYILPVVQYFNCSLYGHIQKLGRSKGRCTNCAALKHTNDSYEVMKCGGCDHNSLSRTCLEYDKTILFPERGFSFLKSDHSALIHGDVGA